MVPRMPGCRMLHLYSPPPLAMNATRSGASTLMENGAPLVGSQPEYTVGVPLPKPFAKLRCILNAVMYLLSPESEPTHHRLLNATSTSRSAACIPTGCEATT